MPEVQLQTSRIGKILNSPLLVNIVSSLIIATVSYVLFTKQTEIMYNLQFMQEEYEACNNALKSNDLLKRSFLVTDYVNYTYIQLLDLSYINDENMYSIKYKLLGIRGTDSTDTREIFVNDIVIEDMLSKIEIYIKDIRLNIAEYNNVSYTNNYNDIKNNYNDRGEMRVNVLNVGILDIITESVFDGNLGYIIDSKYRMIEPYSGKDWNTEYFRSSTDRFLEGLFGTFLCATEYSNTITEYFTAKKKDIVDKKPK